MRASKFPPLKLALIAANDQGRLQRYRLRRHRGAVNDDGQLQQISAIDSPAQYQGSCFTPNALPKVTTSSSGELPSRRQLAPSSPIVRFRIVNYNAPALRAA